MPGDPCALVAPFARAHYYRAAIDMLRGVTDQLGRESGIPRSAVRLFSNSRLPEKPLLVATGLASYGKNGCAIVPGLGSLFIIAGAILPVPAVIRDDTPPAVPADPCGSCRRCRAACPAGALGEPYVVRRDLCLQGMAGVAGHLSADAMAAWGTRLYGCQDCQSACPHNTGLREAAPSSPGEIGPGVSLRALLSETDAERKLRFRGTALGMSWVSGDALLRNALVAAGNSGDGSLRGHVERHSADGPEFIRNAARWALEKLA
jgi:epoxyqueuosine reductase